MNEKWDVADQDYEGFFQVAGQQEQKQIKGKQHHQAQKSQGGKKYLQITYLIINFIYTYMKNSYNPIVKRQTN